MMVPASYLLVLSVLLTGRVFCQTSSPACIDQDDRLSTCASDLVSVNIEEGLDALCRAVERFFVCVHEVNISCPDNAVLLNDNFRVAKEALDSMYHSQCPGNLTDVLCEHDALFERFAPLCYPMVMNAPTTTSIRAMCRTQRFYTQCLERVNAPCVDAENNLARGLSIARTGLRTHCSDENTQDLPEVPLTESTRDTSGAESALTDALEVNATSPETVSCSERSVAMKIAMCSRHIIPTVGNTDLQSKHICKYSRRYLRCIRRLMGRCPNATPHQNILYSPFYEDMVNLCEVDTMRCPFEIMEGDTNMLEYCVRGNAEAEVGSPEFCRDMAVLPRCLIRMKNRCRNRGFRRRHINDWLAAANATMSIYCNDDIEARSLMVDPLQLDIQERSELSGQYDDSDGDEIEEMESFLKRFATAQEQL